MRTSFVVIGAIQPATKYCLQSIRYHFPQDEIILSAWDTCDVSGLEYDKLVQSPDPGSNYNNQLQMDRKIVSAKAGLKLATSPQSVQMRNDLIFQSNQLTQTEYRLPKRNPAFKLFEHFIVVSSLYTVNPQGPLNLPYHVSERSLFGLTTDLQKFWDLPLVDESKPKLRPEQYAFIENIKKTGKNIELTSDLDNNPHRIEETLQYLLSNFRIVDDQNVGIIWAKYPNTVAKGPDLIVQDTWDFVYRMIK